MKDIVALLMVVSVVAGITVCVRECEISSRELDKMCRDSHQTNNGMDRVCSPGATLTQVGNDLICTCPKQIPDASNR
jgi:hypothetical protein